MYYIYLIKNRRKRKTYIGYTNDLKRRIHEHREKNPDLIYYEAYKNKLDARERERQLKKRGQAVRCLKERIRNSLKE